MALLEASMACLAAFLSGSIPMALLLGKMKGVDLRTAGSGNVGATNAFRVLGKGPGIFCLLFDIAKGWAPAFVLSEHWRPDAFSQQTATLILGACAILGHTFSPWLGFKGGKGVATSVGAFLAVQPLAISICFGLGIAIIATTGYVSVASIAGSVLLPVLIFAFSSAADRPWVVIGAAAAVGAFVVVKHRANVSRLLAGTENRLFYGKKPEAPEGGATPNAPTPETGSES